MKETASSRDIGSLGQMFRIGTTVLSDHHILFPCNVMARLFFDAQVSQKLFLFEREVYIFFFFFLQINSVYEAYVTSLNCIS
jgi:hypothetical protein